MKWLLCTALSSIGLAAWGCGGDAGSSSASGGGGANAGGTAGTTSSGGATTSSGGATTASGGTGDTGGATSTGGDAGGGGADSSWLIRVAAGSGFDHGVGLAPVPGGDFVVAGSVVGEAGETVHLGGADDPGQVSLQSNGALAMFLSRYDPSGHLEWAAVAKSTVAADARALTGDQTGVVVAGVYQGTMTFDEGKPGQIVLPEAQKQDVFLARFGFDGALIWVKTIVGPGNEFVEDVTTLSDGSIGVVGYYEDGAQFGEANPVTLTSQQYDDAFVARYSAAGDLLWVKGAGGQGIDQTAGVAATADGGLVVTGGFEQDLVFDRGTPQELTLLSAGSADAFLARFDAAGNLVWARRDGGKDETPGFGDEGDTVVVLANGDLLVAGELDGPSTFGQGQPAETTLGAPDDWANRKMYLARYTGTGDLVWARATGSGSATFGWTIGEKILPREDGSFLVFGEFYESVVFGPGEPKETVLSGQTDFDLSLAAYEGNGDLRWARWAGGPEDQFAGALLPLGQSVLLLGTVRQSAQFQLQSGAAQSFQSTGLSDVFADRITP